MVIHANSILGCSEMDSGDSNIRKKNHAIAVLISHQEQCKKLVLERGSIRRSLGTCIFLEMIDEGMWGVYACMYFFV